MAINMWKHLGYHQQYKMSIILVPMKQIRSHFILMVPYSLPTDAQIINHLSVETLFLLTTN